MYEENKGIFFIKKIHTCSRVAAENEVFIAALFCQEHLKLGPVQAQGSIKKHSTKKITFLLCLFTHVYIIHVHMYVFMYIGYSIIFFFQIKRKSPFLGSQETFNTQRFGQCLCVSLSLCLCLSHLCVCVLVCVCWCVCVGVCVCVCVNEKIPPHKRK